MRKLASASVAAMVVSAAWIVAETPAASADPVTVEFAYTGSFDDFRVPAGVASIDVVAAGAHGGTGGGDFGGAGGKGARVSATVPVTPGELFTVLVGGRGRDGADASCAGGGGFLLGGRGGDSAVPCGAPAVAGVGGGGGGSSSIRLESSSRSVELVAGAGGGGGGGGPSRTGGAGGDGGAGSGPAGDGNGGGGNGTTSVGGLGGTNSCTGTAGTNASSLGGEGGRGGDGGGFGGGGGGGAGSFGGGGGAGSCAALGAGATGGGGGGASTGPEGATFEVGVRDGDGLVTIAYTAVPTLPTSLSYTGPSTAVFGQLVTVSAVLLNGSTPLAGKTVEFEIDGGFGTCTGTTDDTGTASCRTGSESDGAHTVTVHFYGDLTYDSSTTSAPITFGPPSPPAITAGAVDIREGSGATVIANLPVTLSEASDEEVSALWTTVDYQAIAPGDYVAASGTVRFTPGQTSTTIPISVNGDVIDEKSEILLVDVSNPSGATISGFAGLGAVTILDDDPPPTLVPRGASITEGDSGTKVLRIPVTLSAPSERTVSADWRTLDDTASAPSDYVASSGRIVFKRGQTLKDVDVTIKGDTRDEAKERFLVVFSNPTNTVIGGIYGCGFATILDDD